jgi:hypothetical protein
VSTQQGQLFNFGCDLLKRTILGIGSDFGSNDHFLQKRLNLVGFVGGARKRDSAMWIVRVHRSWTVLNLS